MDEAKPCHLRQYCSGVHDPMITMLVPVAFHVSLLLKKRSPDRHALSQVTLSEPTVSELLPVHMKERVVHSRAQPGHCFAPAYTIFKAMSIPILQIRAPKYGTFVVGTFHLDGAGTVVHGRE